MAGVRCIRKPAAPGSHVLPHPLQPARQVPNGCRKQCAEPAGSVTMPCPLRLRTSRPPRPNSKKHFPALLCRSQPNEKKRAVRPRKNGLQKSAVSHERKIAGHRIHSSKNRRSEGLKMLSAGKSAKNKEKYRAKNTQRPESSPTGVFRPALPHDKKIPLPDRQRDPY